MEAAVGTPVSIALVNDYDIVVMGIAQILQQYQDRVVIAELDTNVAVSDLVDIVLYDCLDNRNLTMTRSACWCAIRVPAKLRSTPGTSTPT